MQLNKGEDLAFSQTAFKEYTVLLETGDLKEFFPRAKGDWEKDKKWFCKEYEEQQKLLNDIDVFLESDEFD